MNDATIIRNEQRNRREAGMQPLPTLRALRAVAAQQQIRIHRQGQQWIRSAWSAAMGAWVEEPMHYGMDATPERVALAAALGE